MMQIRLTDKGIVCLVVIVCSFIVYMYYREAQYMKSQGYHSVYDSFNDTSKWVKNDE